MIICHCEVVSDRTVATAVEGGARSLAQVCQTTGAGRKCGGCIFSVKAVVCQHGLVGDGPRMEVPDAACQPADSRPAQ